MLLTLTDPRLQTYIFYSAVLALKLLAVSVLTGVTRATKKVFSNPEDAKLSSGIVKYDDPDVERVRRVHLNDLENIPAFWIIGALYLTTDPFSTWAILLFRVFAVARIVHTIVYAFLPMQPARGITWFAAYLVNVYMGVQVVLYYVTAM